VTAPLRHRERLDPAKSSTGLTFQWERFPAISRELLPLLKPHWREVGVNKHVVPLDIDWDMFFDYDLRGVLHVLTARRQKKLVGYIFNLVGPHMHHTSTKWAATNMYWLEPASREGWAPVKFFIENMRGLKEREAVIHNIAISLHFQSGRVGKIFQRLGYKPTEIMLQKVL
jgi:hypothetical protein